MSHPAHWSQFPTRPDRGRRQITSTPVYLSSFDYLKDHRPMSDQVTPPVGVQTSSTKFGRGFWRRSAAQIAADGERKEYERKKGEREERVWEERKERMRERTAQCTTERDFCQHRKHFITQSTPSPVTPSPPTSQHSVLSSSLPTQHSHIVGVDRKADLLPSYGAIDAFRHNHW